MTEVYIRSIEVQRHDRSCESTVELREAQPKYIGKTQQQVCSLEIQYTDDRC